MSETSPMSNCELWVLSLMIYSFFYVCYGQWWVKEPTLLEVW